VADFDLFLKNRDGSYVLYRGANTTLTEAHKLTLLDNGVELLFISREDRNKYIRYLEIHLESILDGLIVHAEKSTIIYQAASQLMYDVFNDPTEPENLERVDSLVLTTLAQVMGGEDELVAMLDALAYDYSTYTHSVNVTILGLALGKQLGYSPDELHRLGTGLLLHDVGKSQLSQDLLFKPGKLTDEERDAIKQHPILGCDLLRNVDNVNYETLVVIMQHHERCDGSGYPHGLNSDDIHPFGKVSAIVDAFDTLTTKCVFQDAVDTYAAIRTMLSVTNTFCPETLREFILMLNLSENVRKRQPREDRSA
jgi:putative nucleotidyltransferase with HDIG domain